MKIVEPVWKQGLRSPISTETYTDTSDEGTTLGAFKISDFTESYSGSASASTTVTLEDMAVNTPKVTLTANSVVNSQDPPENRSSTTRGYIKNINPINGFSAILYLSIKNNCASDDDSGRGDGIVTVYDYSGTSVVSVNIREFAVGSTCTTTTNETIGLSVLRSSDTEATLRVGRINDQSTGYLDNYTDTETVNEGFYIELGAAGYASADDNDTGSNTGYSQMVVYNPVYKEVL